MAITKARAVQLEDFIVQSGEFTGDGTIATPFSISVVPVSKGGTGATANSGTGNNVLATSPTLVTPNLGVATGTDLTLSSLTASQVVLTDANKKLVSQAATGTGNIVRAASPTLSGTPLSTTATAKTNTTQIATTAFVGKQFTATGSGTGSATTITIAHGVSGITGSSSVIVTPNNAAAAGISYVTIDATNVNIVYATAPVSGTNNLAYSISIK